MDLQLKDKVVVITGGSQGIGKAAALEFAREGARVCVCARRQERLDEAKAEFVALGYELFTRKTDVTKYEELTSFAAEVVKTYGRIDVWINNAGTNHYRRILDYRMEEYQEIVNTNLTAVFFGSQIAAGYMKESGGGVILSAASYSAVTPLAGKGLYAACKSGVVSLTKTMAAEFAPYHIRVNAYIPGLIRTEISRSNIDKYGDRMVQDIPMKRLGEPEDLAKPIVFLASDAAAGYVNGTTLEISGAKRCVQNPWFGYEEE